MCSVTRVPSDMAVSKGKIIERSFWIEFIELYKNHDCLWRVKSKGYMNRRKKNDAYDDLLQKLKEFEKDATVDTVKKKINNFRTVFKKEVKKIDASAISASSADDVYTSSLWYYEHLLFLKDQETPRKSISSLNGVSNKQLISFRLIIQHSQLVYRLLEIIKVILKSIIMCFVFKFIFLLVSSVAEQTTVRPTKISSSVETLATFSVRILLSGPYTCKQFVQTVCTNCVMTAADSTSILSKPAVLHGNLLNYLRITEVEDYRLFFE